MLRFLLVLAIGALAFYVSYLLVPPNKVPDIIDIIQKIGAKFLEV